MGEGILEQKAEDRWNLNLNIHATGWHYIAAMLFVALADFHTVPDRIVQDLSRSTVRDKCTCWCNFQGLGCSPHNIFCKTPLAPDKEFSCGPRTKHVNDMIKHHFLHQLFTATTTGENERISPVLGFVRLLTFEALEMTHTCCILRRVDLAEKRLFPIRTLEGDPLNRTPSVVVNCDPARIEEIRRDASEQQKAQQLDKLMEEFADEIRSLSPSPDALEIFIWGHWRRRKSELFVVNEEDVSDMESVIGAVDTCEYFDAFYLIAAPLTHPGVLPEGVQDLLGSEFKLLTPDVHDAEGTRFGKECWYCKHSTGDTEDDDESDGETNT